MKKQGVRTVGTTARTSEEIEGARSVRTGRREVKEGKERTVNHEKVKVCWESQHYKAGRRPW